MTDLDADEWALAGLGGRALVLRDGKGRALRLVKQAGDTCCSALDAELWSHLPGYAAADSSAERAWLFAVHVLVPLLGERHASAGELVRLPVKFVRRIERRFAACCGTVELKLESVAALLNDAACLGRLSCVPLAACRPVYAVELKPKCGFLPTAETVGATCLKRRVSRFALQQRWKLAQGLVAQVGGHQHKLLLSPLTSARQASTYCPLQLFSGDEVLMSAAVRALLAAPQNNLSVRCNGESVYGGAGGLPVVRCLGCSHHQVSAHP